MLFSVPHVSLKGYVFTAPTREPTPEELGPNGLICDSPPPPDFYLGYRIEFVDGYFMFNEFSWVRAISPDSGYKIYILNPVVVEGKLREPGWYTVYTGPAVDEDPSNPGDPVSPASPYTCELSVEKYERLVKFPFASQIFREVWG